MQATTAITPRRVYIAVYSTPTHVFLWVIAVLLTYTKCFCGVRARRTARCCTGLCTEHFGTMYHVSCNAGNGAGCICALYGLAAYVLSIYCITLSGLVTHIGRIWTHENVPSISGQSGTLCAKTPDKLCSCIHARETITLRICCTAPIRRNTCMIFLAVHLSPTTNLFATLCCKCIYLFFYSGILVAKQTRLPLPA